MRPANQLNNEHSTDKEFLSINELAKRWSVCRQTVNNAISRGAVIPIRMGTRVLIPLSEITRYEQKLLDDAQINKIS